jgi:hypothetical protein
MVGARMQVVLGVSTAHHEAARDLAQTAALRGVLEQLFDAGVTTLVMKGTALSHSVYPNEVRPRNDDDLLVPATDFERAAQVLAAAGYTRATQVTDVAITGQQLFSKRVFGITHHVDLHARPLNPVAFRDLPRFDELWSASVPLAALGRAARAIGPVHALLFACAHRVAHHTPTEDPLWLLDVDRLARVLRAQQWKDFVDAATRARCARICAAELARARDVHGTDIPDEVLHALTRADREPTERHLRPLGPLHVLWLDLRHAHTWADRAAVLKGHLLPPADYMRERFDVRANDSLMAAHTRRWLRGGSRWIAEYVQRLRA